MAEDRKKALVNLVNTLGGKCENPEELEFALGVLFSAYMKERPMTFGMESELRGAAELAVTQLAVAHRQRRQRPPKAASPAGSQANGKPQRKGKK